MPKTVVSFICNQCGATHLKWAGRCDECGAWNSLEETASATKTKTAAKQLLVPETLSAISATSVKRLPTGSSEFDRAVGGGIVPGSVVLLGGEPGIGKSTLLLQLSGTMASSGSVLYVSGEESAAQLVLRAERLGVASGGVQVVTATDSDRVAQTIAETSPSLVIIDSIQTMATDRFSSGPGSITQVRESAAQLQSIAKAHHVPIILVGHVTKEGAIAGPKVLEHLVDVVLYLEGEKWQGYRLLRGVKNRFGPTDEVGVFRMDESGLHDVANPAGAFVDETAGDTPGTAVTASLEGTRVLMVEVQALAVPTSFGYPKRTASGVELNKLQLLIAVLTKHAGLKLPAADVYCNVSGGYRLTEPANDLAIALAVASAETGRQVPAGTVVIGEIGLSGEVRPVADLVKRLEEAARAGFRQAVIPSQKLTKQLPGLKLTPVKTISEALAKAIKATKGKAHAS